MQIDFAAVAPELVLTGALCAVRVVDLVLPEDRKGLVMPVSLLGVAGTLVALLAIAGKVQRGGKSVLPEDITRAREQGATDTEIHDTVLIAAAFCMYNRYVDGLATLLPEHPIVYRDRAGMIARHGYMGAGLPSAK